MRFSGCRRTPRRECEQALERLAGAGTPILRYHARLLLGHAESELGDPRRAYAAYEVARAAPARLPSLRAVSRSHGHFRPGSPMFSGIPLVDTYLSVYDFITWNCRRSW